MSAVTLIQRLDPEEAAAQIYAAHQHEAAWLDAFTQSLDRRRAGQSFARVIATWKLSQAEAARLFGVSRQAVGKWLTQGVPVERTGAVADLAVATELLTHSLKRDRIPAVVRRPIRGLDGDSLMDLLERGDTQALLTACRNMFRFERAQG